MTETEEPNFRKLKEMPLYIVVYREPECDYGKVGMSTYVPTWGNETTELYESKEEAEYVALIKQ